MKLVTLYLALFFLGACSSVGVGDQQRRNVNEYYQSSGVAQYFLPLTPDWANRSETAACMKKEQVQVLDMPKLRKSFALNYEQSLQLQLRHTLSLKETKAKITHRPLSVKESETIFYAALDRVKSGIVEFRVPSFKRIHIIWVDEFILERKPLTMLKRFMNSEVMKKGHPVFLSLCASRSEMESFLKRAELSSKNIRLISSELFSPFSTDMKLSPYDRFYLDEVFSREQKILFFTPLKRPIPEIEGEYKTHYIK